MSGCHRVLGRLFQTRGPETQKNIMKNAGRAEGINSCKTQMLGEHEKHARMDFSTLLYHLLHRAVS